MTTIFIDESGYTGEDLMHKTQPFFVLATLRASEQECKAYADTFFSKVKAPELKHQRLVENRRQNLILDFLQEVAQTPELVKIHICDKKYALTGKIVDRLVKPTMLKKGFDLESVKSFV